MTNWRVSPPSQNSTSHTRRTDVGGRALHPNDSIKSHANTSGGSPRESRCSRSCGIRSSNSALNHNVSQAHRLSVIPVELFPTNRTKRVPANEQYAFESKVSMIGLRDPELPDDTSLENDAKSFYVKRGNVT